MVRTLLRIIYIGTVQIFNNHIQAIMKAALLVIGKTDASYFSEAIDEYKKRLVHYLPFEMLVIPDIKNVKNMSEVQQKEKEGECLLKLLQTGDYVVLLDERGKEYTSLQFAS